PRSQCPAPTRGGPACPGAAARGRRPTSLGSWQAFYRGARADFHLNGRVRADFHLNGRVRAELNLHDGSLSRRRGDTEPAAGALWVGRTVYVRASVLMTANLNGTYAVRLIDHWPLRGRPAAVVWVSATLASPTFDYLALASFA